MPELPEVETVRRGLSPVMEGATIAQAQTQRAGLRWPFPDRMAERLTGAKVLRLGRRSKYLLTDLDSGETLITHLGMSGRMLISGHQMGKFHHEHPAPEKHDHVVLDMDNGARVTFNDPRRFGAMDLCDTDALLDHKLIRVLGPEPLGNEFDTTYLQNALSKRNSPIKTSPFGSGNHRWFGQYLCVRSAVSCRNSPRPEGPTLIKKTHRLACADHP